MTMKTQDRIDEQTAEIIARKELPQVKKECLWVFSDFFYDYGIPVYRVRACHASTLYDLIIDVKDGRILKRKENYL